MGSKVVPFTETAGQLCYRSTDKVRLCCFFLFMCFQTFTRCSPQLDHQFCLLLLSLSLPPPLSLSLLSFSLFLSLFCLSLSLSLSLFSLSLSLSLSLSSLSSSLSISLSLSPLSFSLSLSLSLSLSPCYFFLSQVEFLPGVDRQRSTKRLLGVRLLLHPVFPDW